jgi:hypothetical protein
MRTSYLSALSAVAVMFSTTSALPVSSSNLRRFNGPGVTLTNAASYSQTFYFYNNIANGDGTGVPNFDTPFQAPTTVDPGQTAFVSLPTSFKGRVQRGAVSVPATWAEFQVSASNDNHAHGDISVEQGCDGASTIASTDGTNVAGGFTNDVLINAPAAAIQNKPDGTKALASTMGNWMGGPNQAAIDWLNSQVGQSKAYITGGTGVPDIASSNNVLAITFY